MESSTTRTTLIHRFLPIALLAFSALAAYLCYRQGFQAGFMFDDAISLSGLEGVVDIESALVYAMGGDTGPLGRPLSLASFLLNASSWPSDAGGFLLFNTLLHLANGVLAAWLAWLVARAMPDRLPGPAWFAVLVGAIWLLHPAWVSLVLHAVQRMALLSTTFVLLGLIAYLKARGLMATRPRRAMTLMAASLSIGSILAVLAKENGALLPLFAATLEWLLRQVERVDPPGPVPDSLLGRVWSHWAAALFWVPAIAMSAYMLQHWPGFSAAAALREFTGGERLLTETRVLWQYLVNLYLPRPMNFAPFHDDYPVSAGLFAPITTLYAVLAWAGVAAASWHWRRRYPMAFFAVAWFFVGHAIESTVVQLEIYFEHRNYLPSLGPIMLVVYGLWQLPEKLSRLRWYVAGAYLGLVALVLAQTTSLWGNPAQAAEAWVERHPLSVRTIQYHANSLGQAGQVGKAVQVIWQGHLRLPADTGLSVQSAEFLCWVSRPEDYDRLIGSLLPQLRTGNFSQQPAESLPKMFKQLDPGGCPIQRPAHLHSIIDALLLNPKYQASPRTMATLHYVKGRLYMRDRDFNSTLVHMLESLRLERNLDLILEIATIFASGGLHDEARNMIETAMKDLPANPVIRSSWQKRLEAQQEKLRANRK